MGCHALGLLCLSVMVGSCTLLFNENENENDSAIDTPVVDAAPADSSPVVIVDATVPVSIVPTGTVSESSPVGDSMSGTVFSGLTCPDSSVLYGLQASSFLYGMVDDNTTVKYLCRLQALCSRLVVGTDGKVIRTSLSKVPISVGDCGDGSQVSTVIGSAMESICPNASVATGITLTRENLPGLPLFSQARLRCADVDSNLTFSESMDSPTLGSIVSTEKDFDSLCPKNATVLSINGQAEESINEIFLSCSALAKN